MGRLRVVSAAERLENRENLGDSAAKLESNKLSSRDKSLLPDEKKKKKTSSKQLFEHNTHYRHGHNCTEALQHHSFAALISPLRPVQWQQMTNGFGAFPGQDTNFHPPKAFSRHLMLHQSKCQVLETETGGNFTSRGGRWGHRGGGDSSAFDRGRQQESFNEDEKNELHVFLQAQLP